MNTQNTSSLSIIVPTYQEAENLPLLIESIESVAKEYQLSPELLIMDDDSQDGTEEIVRDLAKPWVTLVVRKGDRGLSQAVIDGFRRTKHNTVVVMDADLSHPPSAIPRMLQSLDQGNEFVVGSRYLPGASTHDKWALFRWINSKGSALLAYPLTTISDPMSGFFAFRKNCLPPMESLDPIGYKILLELLVKCEGAKVHEIPIHFGERRHGESKLSLREQRFYLKHIRRLFDYKYSEGARLLQYLLVGTSGLLVNLGTMTFLHTEGAPLHHAIAAGIAFSVCTNFAFNKKYTFKDASSQPFPRRFLKYLGACSFAAIANYITAMSLVSAFPLFSIYPQIASLFGIAVDTGLNYSNNRFLVFKKARGQ